MLAIKSDMPDLALYFAQKGVDIDGKNIEDEYPLTVSIEKGFDDLSKKLIDMNAKLDVKSGYMKNTPLMIAILNNRHDIAEKLIKAGADPDVKNSDDYTALMHAISSRNVKIAKLLLENGADTDIKASDDSTALSLAKDQGLNEMIELIKQ